MRQTLSRGVFAAAAATGILSLYGTPALADSFTAGGTEASPGVMSEDTVGALVHAPVNVCGNALTGIGAFNGAFDNSCVNGSHASGSGSSTSAHGDSSGAHAVGGTEGLPDVLSRNDVQALVDAPVNLCGNSVQVAGLGNEASDNVCANTSHGHSKKSEDSSYGDSSYGDSGGAHAEGSAVDSPDVLYGNQVRVPVHVPVNVCGNSLDLLGLFNDAYGNTCVNEAGYGEEDVPGYGEEDVPEKETPEPPAKVKTPPAPGAEEPPAQEPPAAEVPGSPPHLAETGSEGMIAASAAGAVLITGGAMLYRRGRLAARR
ncbi:chaplin family protein [Streptomyces griseoloalbus]|uniref:Chaplin family protein n=1 Tax=Streptomyces griseoloalbus TaxID=67303 RepID=A0ABV3EAL0_9ACTN